ncbi:endocuticle structural glycoprotein SgAbd-4-like [Athalia rosae]|uniref:endocuticle structural glycoprotein SgAbd-4-like n=1 Tax=Athalia rosae TaxID=37344 RepID=UPI002034A15F|nr:endocuticle structural glycoprotein SgAbd-4-like [Athalia rosae]
MPAAELLKQTLAVSDYNCIMYTALVTLLALSACVLARPAGDSKDPIPIVSQESDGPNPDGSYKWSYETGNGIKAQEEGSLVDAGTEKESISAKGSYSYTGDDGVAINLSYTADGEGGFKPVGDHLPTPPPTPEAILKALEWNAAHPSKEDDNQV